MLFNSLEFLVFFPVVTLLYFALPHRWRWGLLLAASCLFYMAFIPAYLSILAFTIVIDYFAGIWIEKATGTRRKWYLAASVAANVGVLAIFKYYNFVNDNLRWLVESLGHPYLVPSLDIILPIGLSFHTFQAMSYTIEVYRRHERAERHFGIYALYVMFYPQLVAGPIERPQNMLHQFHERHRFSWDNLFSGLKMMLWGMFKKTVIADRLAIAVNHVYAAPDDVSGLPLLLATYFFAFQIYCDFSGYSDIARGAARVMGYELMVNFRRPYLAVGCGDFWSRWHISLSTWFRDYLYIPLGGNRVTKLKLYRNLMIVFVISGVWHGANWTYVVWGGLHAIFLIAENLLRTWAPGPRSALGRSLARAIGGLVTFHVVLLSWVFFRARSVSESVAMIRRILTETPAQVASIVRYGPQAVITYFPLRISRYEAILSVALIAVLWVVEWFEERAERRAATAPTVSAPRPLRHVASLLGYDAMLVAILLLGVFRETAFIYFQF